MSLLKKIAPLFIASLAFIIFSPAAFAEDCMRDPFYPRDWNAEVTTGAFLRSIPCMTGSEVYTTVPVGEVVHVIEETDGWYKIERSSGQEGWVGQWLITETGKPFTASGGDTITAPDAAPETVPVEEPVIQHEPLYDVEGHINEDAIRELYNMGIVSGHPDGSFKPDDPLNRAELVKLLVEATVDDFATIKNDYRFSCFPDVPASEWYTPYVCYAKEYNIVEGYPDGNFRPANNINKVEAVKVVLEAFGWIIAGPPADFSFDDTSADQWYAPYLQAAHQNNILEEKSGNFHPDSSILRGGVSHIIYETLMSPKTAADASAPASTEDETETSGGAETTSDSISCAPLSTISGDTFTVENVNDLVATVATLNATGGDATVLIEDGTYQLDSELWVEADDIIFRSASGDRSAVTIKGNGMDGDVPFVFGIAGNNITIADISIGEVANHAIQVHGESDYNVGGLYVHNVRFFNTGEQMLKGSSDYVTGSDNGVVECSLFEYTAGQGPQYYIGGIDVHLGDEWAVRDNVFKNIRSPESELAEHAIHFWSDSSDMVVERNTIINCDRGIGFGLGDRGTNGGIIRNNFIYNDGEGLNEDVGIGLENAEMARVYNNTVILTNYDNAIEYRFANSNGIEIANNLTNKAIIERDGASAELNTNFTSAQLSWFVSPASGDLHLASEPSEVVDRGTTLAEVTHDMDKETRPSGAGFDIGADEI